MEKENLSERIIKYVIAHYPCSYSKLEAIVISKGFTLDQLLQALEIVHKDKRIKQTVKGDDIMYSPTMAPVTKEPGSHLTWWRTHYPRMDSTNDGSGIEADFSYLFLKPAELEEYKAAAKNMPKHMIQSKYGKGRKQSPKRNTEISSVQRSLLLAQQ